MNQSTQVPPPPNPDDVPAPNGIAYPIGGLAGSPDICVNGYTMVTVTPCTPTPATPSPEVACQNLEWRDQLTICANVPLRSLPETGTASLPIAGTGLFALVAGMTLLKLGRRIA